jgi:hypothetical protein
VDSLELADSLVDRFQVDLLFPVAQTEPITSFVKAHDYLYWPEFDWVLFNEAWQNVPPSGAFVVSITPPVPFASLRGGSTGS